MENNHSHIILKIWINLCRFALAIVFTFSGFVKAIDPHGFEYKLQDYIVAFELTEIIPSFLPLTASILLAALEFTLGVFFFFGIRRKLTTTLTLLLMAFMTPFTLYLAITNPVSDCGCFGEAVIISNWQTFWKNVFLLIAAISAFKWGNYIIRFVSYKSQWLVVLYTVLFIFSISFYCLRYLPIIDFRPYKIGASIPEGMIIPENAKKSIYETRFILEKNGVKEEFTLDNYPDSTWSFVDSRSVLKEKGYEPAIHDFSIIRLDDGEDITEEVLENKSYTFLLIAHRIESASDSNIDLINEIYDYSVENGYAFYCLTSSPETQIDLWKDKAGAEYPFCLTDDVALKTIIRSNPGLVLLKDGIVINKWSHNRLPDEYILVDKLDKLSIGQLKTYSMTYTIGKILLWFIVPLLLFKGLDMLLVRRMANRLKIRKKSDKE